MSVYVPNELKDPSSWEGSFPPERLLIAMLASVSAEDAAVLLRRMLDAALEEFDRAADPKFLRNRQAFAPGAVTISRHADDWEFPGGNWLEDALMAIEASEGQRRVPAKSVTQALAAMNAIVHAVIELRDYLRDPADWSRHRKAFEAATTPREMLELGAAEKARNAQKATDAREVWGRLLMLVTGEVGQ